MVLSKVSYIKYLIHPSSVGIILALCLIFVLELIYDEELKNKRTSEIIALEKIIENTYYITFAKISLYLITLVFTCQEKKYLTEEIQASPLTSVDENLTEELYKNILQQSKNPEDNNLIEQFQKISVVMKLKRMKTDNEEASISKNNLTLEENSSSEILNPKVLDSINNFERRSDLSDYKEISSKIIFLLFLFKFFRTSFEKWDKISRS
jgi:hypothetical protein